MLCVSRADRFDQVYLLIDFFLPLAPPLGGPERLPSRPEPLESGTATTARLGGWNYLN